MTSAPASPVDWRTRAAALAIETQAFIDGRYVPAASGLTFDDVSPIDGRVIAHVASTDQADVDRAVAAARRPNRAMALMHERYAPGADTGADMLRHEGEEGGVVVSGRIDLTVGAETRQLGPGDAYYFTSAIPHRFRNTGAEPCEIISASTPPTF